LYIVFKIIDTIDTELSWVEAFKQNYLKWLFFGLLFTLLSISKSIAIVSIVAVVLYFVFNKNFKQAVYAVIAFVAIRFIYILISSALFGANDTDQLEMMLRIDLYNPAKGHEDFGGMFTRFFNNFNTYISLHMYRILNPIYKHEYTLKDIFPQLAYITTVVLAIFTFLSYKKNKFIFFSSIYLIVLCGGIFFGVQANNMQDRLLIIAMPLIFLVLFFGLYDLAKRVSSLQYVFILFSAVMLLITIGKSSIEAKKNTIALKKNLNGDIYYGYTPDWENFLKMSKYCADSLPADAQVLSRKPNMSFIYGNGKKFPGQFWVSTTNADSALMEWHKQNITYVILASLRQKLDKNNGQIINTLHRMLQPVAEKYPQKLRLVKTIGTEEPTYLYEIKY
jgi:4-amino-4-deoxy-L-arabinose transferase-like glycosyltransferase